MRATEHAPRGPFHVPQRRHGLAEIVERGGGVLAERLRVNFPHLERDLITLSENALHHGHRLAARESAAPVPDTTTHERSAAAASPPDATTHESRRVAAAHALRLSEPPAELCRSVSRRRDGVRER